MVNNVRRVRTLEELTKALSERVPVETIEIDSTAKYDPVFYYKDLEEYDKLIKRHEPVKVLPKQRKIEK